METDPPGRDFSFSILGVGPAVKYYTPVADAHNKIVVFDAKKMGRLDHNFLPKYSLNGLTLCDSWNVRKMKITCSKCGLFKEPNRMFTQRYCNACHAETMRLTRPKYSELDPIAKKKANARSYTKVYAKRGLIKREPCNVCKYEITQFHHEDYDKPLHVISLCQSCHIKLHKQQINERTNQQH